MQILASPGEHRAISLRRQDDLGCEQVGAIYHNETWLVGLLSAGVLQQDRTQDLLSINAYLSELWYHTVDLQTCLQLKLFSGNYSCLPTLERKYPKIQAHKED